MCEKVVEKRSCSLHYVPDLFKAKEMCEKVVEKKPFLLHYVPGHLKTKEMCEKLVEAGLGLLKYVPDYFVTHQQIKIWRDDDEYCNDHEFIKWYRSYKKRKSQKAKIKEELMLITWRPSRWWDWLIPEDEKQETEKIFLNT